MKKLTITRRTFLKAAAVTGVAAAVFSPDMSPLKGLVEAKESASGGGEVKVIKSVCRSCHGGCWALVHVREGRVVKVEGDPEGDTSLGSLCAIGQSAPQILYHPDRIKYPMKRVGARGEGKWQRISWDEALDTISKKIIEVWEKYGPEFIVGQCGTSRGTEIYYFCKFMDGALMTPNLLSAGTICHVCCAWVAEAMGVITRGPGVTNANPSIEDSNLVLTAGSGRLGYSSSAERAINWDSIVKGKKKLIDVDPNFDRNEASKADLWLPIRPGTDCALWLGFLNVIIAEDLYDKEFVREWTTGPFLVRIEPKKPLRGTGEDPGPLLTEADIKEGGKPTRYMVWDELTGSLKYWDATPIPPLPKAPPYPTYPLTWETPNVKPALFGTYKVRLKDGREVECKPAWQIVMDRVKEWTPEKAAEITWIPADKIRDMAKMYATIKPAHIELGVAIDMHISHTQTLRLLSILNGITGNLEYGRLEPSVPGYIRIEVLPPTIEFTPEHHKKRIGGEKYPMFAKPMFLYPMIPPDAFLEAMLIGKPYKPKATVLWTATGLWVPNQKEAFKAFKEFEFSFTIDIFMTPTAAISDIVLPAGIWLEKDDIQDRLGIIKLQQKAVGPLWEAMHDGEIAIKLSHALGVADRVYPWKNLEEMLDVRIKGTGYTFEEFKKIGHIDPPPSTYPVAKHKMGLWRKPPLFPYVDKKPGFPTPTGKLEIYSVKLKEWGYDPIYLHYVEPPESPYSTPELARKYPLILTTGKRMPVYFHSEHRQIPWLRELIPAPLLDINPETADKLGIEDGDWVWIETPRGRVRHVARLTNGVHPRVVQAYQHNWFYPEKPETPENPKGAFDSNINVLMDHVRTDPVSANTAHRGLLCKVYKAVEGAPEGVWTKPEQFKAWLPQPPGGE